MKLMNYASNEFSLFLSIDYTWGTTKPYTSIAAAALEYSSYSPDSITISDGCGGLFLATTHRASCD